MSEAKISRKVLVVEDEPSTQALLVDIFKNLGIEPAVASKSDKAISLLNSEFFDLIVLDVELDGISGIEIAKGIREKEKDSKQRSFIVAITGRDAEGDRQLCLDAGMDGYFKKPIKRFLLRDFFRALMSKM